MKTASSNLAIVAKRLESDLRARGLRKGDRYLTVSEAALLLGVSTATAHRAMDLLVGRKLLVRQQGRGTFVGTAIGPGPKVPVRTVFVLLPEDQEGVTGVELEAMLNPVRHHMHGANVLFALVPQQGALDYVRELIGPAQSVGQYAGAVPISCSREVYQYLEEIGGPMVVLGSTYPDQHHIASVNTDNRQAGSLLAHYLVGRGHKRMALLMTGEGRPGDHAFFDGVSDALTEASLSHNALIVRIFPKSFDLFRAHLRELLSRPDRPTGIICRSESMMSMVVAVAEELGLSIPAHVEPVFEGSATSSLGQTLTRVEPKLPFRSVGEMVAKMLNQLAQGRKLECERVVIPVELRGPGVNGGKRGSGGA